MPKMEILRAEVAWKMALVMLRPCVESISRAFRGLKKVSLQKNPVGESGGEATVRHPALIDMNRMGQPVSGRAGRRTSPNKPSMRFS